ncbi:MAG: DUF2807 domain-containing protein [Terricaulis sp.]
MKTSITAALAAIAVLSAASMAGAEPRDVGAFDSVRAQDNLRVDIIHGAEFSVDVSGVEAARVRTEVRDGTLQVSEINRPWFGHDRQVAATIHVTMPSVKGLASAKGATVIAEGVQGTDVSLAAAMGGELRVSGACTVATVAASMGAVIRAQDFQCAHATISASMGGDAQVFASAGYTASASMGGEVKVLGGGVRGQVSTSFGGEVSQD